MFYTQLLYSRLYTSFTVQQQPTDTCIIKLFLHQSQSLLNNQKRRKFKSVKTNAGAWPFVTWYQSFCFHANIQSASFRTEWKPNAWELEQSNSFLQWLISRCMYAWVFVNMCSFLIFVFKYAVIISGICKLEDSRGVLLDFTEFYYWVIIKYCVIPLQVWICSFNFYRKFKLFCVTIC